MRKIPEADTVRFNLIFFDSESFFSTFLSRNNLIFQKNATWKADEIVSKPKIVLRKIVSNTERKTRQPEKAGEVYQNQETHGDTRRVDSSEVYKN